MEFQQHSSPLDRLVPDPEDSSKDVYRIGDLAKEFGVTLRTLRFYEDRGLVRPDREGSTRLYSRAERARLKVILLAKQVGFSLVDIHGLMEIYDKGSTLNDPLGAALQKFVDQLRLMEQQRDEIHAAIGKLNETISQLRRFNQEQE